MKRVYILFMPLLFLLGLSRCGKEENIVFPFTASDVEYIESYYDNEESEIQKKQQQRNQTLIICTHIFLSCQ